MSYLNVSEYFYSIQGEGKYQGYPAVFLRLQDCNLYCGMPKNNDLTKPTGNAKWVCDTICVWRKGKAYSYNDLYKNFKNEKIIEKLEDGAHLVITGGEPMLQQIRIAEFINFLKQKMTKKPFIEIETNGTIIPLPKFDKLVNIYNISPKLKNSGNLDKLRYNPIVLQNLTLNKKSTFKFVVLDLNDLKEVKKDFINKFNISNEKIWLMPGAYNREDLWKNGQAVAELCKKYNLKMSSRMQVEIWDRLTGV